MTEERDTAADNLRRVGEERKEAVWERDAAIAQATAAEEALTRALRDREEAQSAVL